LAAEIGETVPTSYHIFNKSTFYSRMDTNILELSYFVFYVAIHTGSKISLGLVIMQFQTRGKSSVFVCCNCEIYKAMIAQKFHKLIRVCDVFGPKVVLISNIPV
jgi:hypothetical protein